MKRKNRTRFFRGFSAFLKLFIHSPKFIHTGDTEIKPGSLILSNHVGTTAPLKLEFYLPHDFRFWGAHQMNEGLIPLYKYLSRVFYHEKKHWPLWLARLFCIIAAPVANLFYSGLNLISTYTDIRFKRTVSESLDAISAGESLIIFPEDSSSGYHDVLTGFHAGFATLAKIALRRGHDLTLYPVYYRKADDTVIVGTSVLFSELWEKYGDTAAIAEEMCARVNALRTVTESTGTADAEQSKQAVS